MNIDPETVLKNWVSYTAGEATTDITVKPTDIDPEKYGHHCSYADGKHRYWRFEDSKGYFRFIADYWDNLNRRE